MVVFFSTSKMVHFEEEMLCTTTIQINIKNNENKCLNNYQQF